MPYLTIIKLYFVFEVAVSLSRLKIVDYDNKPQAVIHSFSIKEIEQYEYTEVVSLVIYQIAFPRNENVVGNINTPTKPSSQRI